MFAVNRRFPLFRKVVIALFAMPLMFAGGAFLGGLAQSQTVGEVGSLDIPRSEFVGRYQSAAEEYRRATGNEEIPASVADRITRDVQSGLLSYYLMQAAIKQKGIYAPDSVVAEEIRQTPDFQDENGDFSVALYKEFVSDSRYYQERVREAAGREAILRAMQPLPDNNIREQLARFRRQQRVLDEAAVQLSELTTVTLNVPIDDVNLYYQRNSRQYRLREEADFEYFVFALEDFAASITVDADAVAAAYTDFAAEQTGLSRRQASHIYILDEELAREVAAQAQAAPENFAELAAEYSTDAASADFGGELGIVADGDLPAALNEVLFTLSVGQVHAPIEVEEGGFSILKLDAIIAEEVPPLQQVRDAMQQRARRDAAREDFENKTEDLRDLAVVEFGSLLSLAVETGTSLTVATTVYRDAAQNRYPFNEEGVLLDVFDPLVISSNENSAPIPLADDAYLFVRALRYQPAGVQPLAEVGEGITDILRAGYVVSDLYRQLDALHLPPTTLTVAGDDSFFGDDITPVTTLLEAAQWDNTYTVALSSDEDDEAALNTATGEDISAADAAADTVGVDDIALDRIFSADLSHGLPAYVFIPQEEKIKIYRIREIYENEPTEQDYEVIDELLADMSDRLTGLGYLDELSQQYNFQFYNLPQVTEAIGN